MPLIAPHTKQAMVKLITFQRRHDMRNFDSIARNIGELTRLTIFWIVISIIKMVRSSLPTPKTKKAPVMGTTVRMNAKDLCSSKLRWPTSRLR